MKKIFILFFVCCIFSGCTRAFWVPDWDKAESERLQVQLLQRQVIALEQIAISLDKLATK